MRALSFTFMQQALLATTVVCAVAPLVGTFVVQRRQSLVGDGMGHVAFAGVGLAFLAGAAPLLGALGLAIVAALALFRLQRSGLGGDLALALLFYGGISLGYLFASRSGVGLNQLLGFLFGSPLNLSWPQVAAILALSATVLIIVAALYGALVAIAFDEQAARVSGVPTEGLALTLTLVVALIVVGGMSAIGLLLISAMMVIPVAAAAELAASYRGTMLLASLIGGASAVAGLFVAFYADYTPGATVVLVAIAAYLLAATARRAIPAVAR
jgi:zinc transport system permease protein